MSVPPLFSNFGKSTTDLFKKKYEADPVQFKSIRKAKNGLTVESGGVNVSADAGNYLRGYTKLSLSNPSYGSSELELHTDLAQTTKISTKFSKLYPGFVLQIALASVPTPNAKKPNFFDNSKRLGSLEGTYSQSGFQAQLKLSSDAATKSKADVSASLGYENWSLGGQLSVDTDHSLLEVQEPQVGGEYTQDDLTFSLFSSLEKGARCVNASYFQRVSRDLVSGATFKINTVEKAKSTMTVGTDYRLDADTGLKAKVELPTGKAALAIEHRLESPQVLVGLSSEFDVSNPQQVLPGKFGFSFSFGDF